jgi:hypothetical protein
MSGTIRIVQHGVIELDGAPAVAFGEVNKPYSISFTEKHEVTATLAASGKATLLDIIGGNTGNAGGSHMAGFSFLLIASSRDLLVEMVVDDGATFAQAFNTITVKGSAIAGQLGPLTVLFSDVANAGDHTTENFGDGTLDVIEIIRVLNQDASNTATVKLIACK